MNGSPVIGQQHCMSCYFCRKDLPSQLGYIMCLLDGGKGNKRKTGKCPNSALKNWRLICPTHFKPMELI